MEYVNPHPPGCYWYDVAEKFGPPNIKWCEETICHVISEPANTWSNLSYVLAFVVMYILSRKLKSKSLRYTPYAMLIMGVGSFYFHMSNFHISQAIDFIGMFFFVHWLFFINLMRANIFNLKNSIKFYIGFMLLNTIVIQVAYSLHFNYQFLIIIAVVLILSTEYLARKKGSQPKSSVCLIAGAICMAIAETFSLLDLSRVMCNPSNHIIQGHAIWHVIGGIGLFIVFLYYLQFDNDLE